MAAVDIGVAHAKAFGAEEERHTRRPGGRWRRQIMHWTLLFKEHIEMRARRCRWRSEVARRHRGGAQVADAIEGLLQSGNDAGLPEQVQGAAGALYGFFV